MTQPDDPLLPSVPPGSPADAALRDSLRTLRDSATSEEQRRLYDDILHGRRPPRDLLRDPGFGELATAGFRQYEEQQTALADHEREAIERQARTSFEVGDTEES